MSGADRGAGRELRDDAVRNTMWASLSFFSAKAATFVSTLVLARLLVPEDFGAVAIVLLAIRYLEILNDFGMGQALISRDPEVKAAPHAAMVTSLALSVVLYAAAWLGAPSVAEFFDEPDAVDLLRVLALVLPIQALGAAPRALLQRDMRFRRLAAPEVSRALVKGLISVVLAVGGLGAWALIWGQLAGEVVSTIWYITASRFRLRFRHFDRAEAAVLVRYGRHIVGIGLIGALASNADYIIVGRRLGVIELGLYTIAFRLPELVIQSLARITSSVAHPLLARSLREENDVESSYLGYTRGLSLVAFPVGVGMALIAPMFVATVYGEKWIDSGPAMAAISAAMTVSSLLWVSGALYKATNRPDLLHRISWARLVPTILILLVASEWGIVGVAIGQIVVACCNVALELGVASRVLGVSIGGVVRSVQPALVSVLVMATVAAVPVWLLERESAVAMAIVVGIGAVTYLAALRQMFRSSFDEAMDVVRAVTTRKVKVAVPPPS